MKTHPNHTNSVNYIGIDLAKHSFEAFFEGKFITLPNQPSGFERLINMIASSGQTCHVCCEATGSYGVPLIRALLREGIAVSQINPIRIKDYIRSFGQLAKTDRIDARFITSYAEDRHPEPLDSDTLKHLDLQEQYRHLRHLIRIRAELKASIDKYHVAGAKSEVAKHISYFDQEIKSLQNAILSAIKNDPELGSKYRILLTIQAVGPKTAMSLLLDMPELGTLNRRQAAALAGLAPIHNDSGTFHGKRSIRRGRKTVRSILYMAAFTAAFKNPVLSTYYQHLRNKGKAHQVALIAVARKLLIHINTMLNKDLQKNTMKT